MKRLLLPLAIAALLSMPGICNAKAYKSVIISRHDGTSLSIKAEQGLTMKVVDEEVKFFTTGDNNISIPVSEIKGLSLSAEEGEHSADVNEIVGNGISVARVGNEIILENLPAGSNVSLVSLSGKTLYKSAAEGSHSIDISSCADGVYIVTFNKKSLKISIAR